MNYSNSYEQTIPRLNDLIVYYVFNSIKVQKTRVIFVEKLQTPEKFTFLIFKKLSFLCSNAKNWKKFKCRMRLSIIRCRDSMFMAAQMRRMMPRKLL